MKKICLLIVSLMLYSAGLSNAQIIRSYGIKAGGSLAEQKWKYAPTVGIDASYIKSIWGFDAGIFVEYMNLPNFSFITELHYVQRGRTLNVVGTVVDPSDPSGYKDVGPQEMKQRFDYVSIPVLVKLRFDNDFATPYLTAGPTLDFLVSYPESPVYDKFNKTELGIKISAGVNLQLDKMPQLIMECSYNQSLTNTYINENVTVTNRGFVFLLGIVL